MRQFPSLLIVAIGLGFAPLALAADCNRDGIEDAQSLMLASSKDCNSNGIPDECDISTPGLAFVPAASFNLEGRIVAVGDYDGDGDLDLLRHEQNSLMIDSNNSQGDFSAKLSVDFSLGMFQIFSALSGIAGNFANNGANKSEAIVPVETFSSPGPRFGGGLLYLIQEDNSAFISSRVSILPGAGFPGSESIRLRFSSLQSADINGDGLNDLIFSAQIVEGFFAETVAIKTVVALNTGDGDEFLPIFAQDVLGELVVGNIGGDSQSDIVVYSEQQILAFITLSNNTFSSLSFSAPGYISGITIDPSSPPSLFVSLSSNSSAFPQALQQLQLHNGNLTSLDVKPSASIQQAVDLDNDSQIDLLGTTDFSVSIREGTALRSAGQIFERESEEGILFIEDFNNDGLPDLITAERLAPTFSQIGRLLLNQSNLPLGSPVSFDVDLNRLPDECQRSTVLDFNGDLLSDRTVVRPLLGGWQWFIDDSSSSTYQFGLFNSQFADAIFAGDYDGDGKVEPGVLRNINNFLYWYSRTPSGDATVTQWGIAGDYALTGYFDADKSLDRAVVREVLGGKYWFIKASNGEPIIAQLWGLVGDVPFSGDLNGDGIDELIVARRQGLYTIWYARSLDGQEFSPFIFGLSQDELLPPYDFYGDGIDRLMVARRQNGEIQTFIGKFGTQELAQTLFGLSSDIVLTGSFSIPGRSDVTVFRGNPISFYADFFMQRIFEPIRTGVQKQFGLWNDYVVTHDGTAKQIQ